MNAEFDDEIREFLIESNENLALLDQQIVQLEQQPHNQELISGVFRTIHSVKGTCGFFGFDILGAVTHITESILGQLRERKRELTPELITLILEAVDAVKVLLGRIEATGSEGEDETEALRERLEAAYRSCGKQDTVQEMLESLQAINPPAVKESATATAKAVVSAEQPALTPTPAIATDAGDVAKNIALSTSSSEADPSQDGPVAPSACPVEATIPPAPTDEVKGAAPAASEGQLADSTIRVDVNLLNQLMNLVGELVLTRNQLLQSAGNFSPGVQQTSQRLNIITTELQESVMKTRMQPIGMVWSKLPRVVRDLSAKCGKQIHLEMHGAETELDKSLIEAIRDPLTHIVRNSCDHGIETPQERLAKGKPGAGLLSLRAFHEAGAVNIEISDDGAGIDPDRVRRKAIEKKLITPDHAASLSPAECINLIFLPGFSTAQQVTSISGRGVGMDVVKTNIEKIAGSVQIICPPTGGTCLRIKIPLTLAIIPGLIVATHATSDPEERFVIPQSHLVEMTRVGLAGTQRNVDRVNGALVFRHRGRLLPLVYLSSLLNGTRPAAAQEFINVIVLQVQGKQFGLVVDQICDTQEIVVKPLGKLLKHLACYGGATIMGDGRPALILDVGGIAKLAGLDAQQKEGMQNHAATRRERTISEFILFRAGKEHRMALPLTIVNRLEELPASSVEHAAGQAVVRYRGELLPLLSAAALVGESAPTMPTSGNIHVIVITNGTDPFGLVVEGILDIVGESLSSVRSSSNPALLGSAVIGGLVTDIVDVTALRDRYGNSWEKPSAECAASWRLALYNPWSLGAEMLSTLLDASGFSVTRFTSADDLKQVLLRGEIDLLIVDNGVRSQPPAWLHQARSKGGSLAHVPTVQLTDPALMADKADDGCPACVRVDRTDRQALLGTLEQMLCRNKAKAA